MSSICSSFFIQFANSISSNSSAFFLLLYLFLGGILKLAAIYFLPFSPQTGLDSHLSKYKSYHFFEDL